MNAIFNISRFTEPTGCFHATLAWVLLCGTSTHELTRLGSTEEECRRYPCTQGQPFPSQAHQTARSLSSLFPACQAQCLKICSYHFVSWLPGSCPSICSLQLEIGTCWCSSPHLFVLLDHPYQQNLFCSYLRPSSSLKPLTLPPIPTDIPLQVEHADCFFETLIGPQLKPRFHCSDGLLHHAICLCF